MYYFVVCDKQGQVLPYLNSLPGEDVIWTATCESMDAIWILPENPCPDIGAALTALTGTDISVVARQLITYGLGSRETVTYSSITERGCMLALQRDIVTLQGHRLERQEIHVPLLKDPLLGLGLASALLLAGRPPRQLPELMSLS